MAAKDDVRTLLVEESGGSFFKITIPADFRVTFGSVPKGGYEKQLRIYESETKQRACFDNIRSFRDLSLPLERYIVTEQGETKWETDEQGSTQTKSVKRAVKKVKNTDDIPF